MKQKIYFLLFFLLSLNFVQAQTYDHVYSKWFYQSIGSNFYFEFNDISECQSEASVEIKVQHNLLGVNNSFSKFDLLIDGTAIATGVRLDGTQTYDLSQYIPFETVRVNQYHGGLGSTLFNVAYDVKLTIKSPMAEMPSAPVTSNVFYGVGAIPEALTASLTGTGTRLKWYSVQTGGMPVGNAFVPSTNSLGTTTYWVSEADANDCESLRSPLVINIVPPSTHLNFDGVNDRIDLGPVIASSASYTKEAMIQAKNISGGHNILSSTGDVFWIYQNTLRAGHSADFSYVSASAINLLDSWNHVAVTYDAPTTTMKLYINGSLVSENNAVPPATGNALQIGAYASAAFFNGDMDEIRIWDRALSLDELNRRKNCELNGTEEGLLAYYDFSQGLEGAYNSSITALPNLAADANNGILYNFSLANETSNWIGGSPILSGIKLPLVPTAVSPLNYVQGVMPPPLATTSVGTNLWYTTAAGGDGSQVAPTASTTALGTTSYWVSALNASGCESERSEIIVNITEQLPATHLDLDGVNDYVVLPNESDFDFTNQMTVEFWMNSNTAPQQWDALVAKGDDSWRISLTSGGKINFAGSGAFGDITSNTTVTDGNWHHVSVTYNGVDVAIYIDGALDKTATGTGTINNSSYSVSIGENLQAMGRNYKGSIEEVRLWNVARTIDQISSTRNCELNGNENGLIAYYKFNQGISSGYNVDESTLADATSNGNDAALTNFSLNGKGSNFSLGSPVVSGIAIPSEATVTTPINYYQFDNATPLEAISGGSGLLWYTTPAGGTGTTTAPIPSTATAGTTSFWVSSTNANGCESERVEVVVTVTEAQAITYPTAISPQVYSGTATLADLTATGTNLQWYAAVTGGTALPLTTALVDNATYYVSQTSGSVESFRIPVTTKKISEATQTVCNGATVANLITTPSENGTVEWFTSASGGTALTATEALATGTYYVEQALPETTVELGSGFNPIYGIAVDAYGTIYISQDFLSETKPAGIKKMNNDGSNIQTIGSGFILPRRIAVDNEGNVYVVDGFNIEGETIIKMSNDGGDIQTILPASGLNNLQGIAVDAQGIIYVADDFDNTIKKMNNDGSNSQDIWTSDSEYDIMMGIGLDAQSNIYLAQLFNNYIMKVSNDGSDIDHMGSGLVGPSEVTLDTQGNIYFIEVDESAVKKMDSYGNNIQTIGSGFNDPYRVAVDAWGNVYVSDWYSYNNCAVKKITPASTSNRVAVNVNVDVLNAPTVTTPVNYTQNDTATALTAATEAAGLLWYDTATGGTGSATAPTPATATAGTTSYWVASVNENSCESARVEIVVTVTEAPAYPAPTALVNQIYAGTATIAALTATGTNLQWYAAATGGQPLALTTALVDGSTYYVSQTSDGIESTRTAVTAKKISDATQTVCNGATVANLITTPSENGTVEWFATATDGIALDETAALETGSYYVEQTVLENTSNRVLVTVVAYAAVVAPTVSSPISYAQGAVASALTATSGSVALVWYPVAAGGTGSTSAPIPSTAAVGTTSYWVASVNANGCESARTEIVVGITQDVLTIGSHPSNANITGGQDTSFTAAVNGVTINYQWQVSHDGGSTFTDLTNDGIYSGVTSASLTLTNVPISMDGKQYKVKVSNGSEVFSDAALLTVTMPPFDNTRVWNNAGDAGFSAGTSQQTVITSDNNGIPYVAFSDGANSNRVTVMKFTGTEWVTVGEAGFSEVNDVFNLNLVFDASNMPHIGYVGGIYPNTVVQVKKYTGTAWENLGGTALTYQGKELSLVIDPSNHPVIAYSDANTMYKMTVRKFDGNAWLTIGTAGFTQGDVYDSSLAIDPNGTPYVVCRDEWEGKPVAMKYNGSEWVFVGPPSGFYDGVAFYTSIVIDRAGTPYVTFVDYSYDELMVMKYDGTAWVAVGNSNFASGVLYNSSMVLDASGTPFVAFPDFNNNNKATVKRFDGTSWTTVGTAGFSTSSVEHTAITLDSEGTPYVVFVDDAMANKTTVMRFSEDPTFLTTWINQIWDNGVPNLTMKAVIKDDLTLSTNLEAKELIVTQIGSIVVASGTTLEVNGKITNYGDAAHFLVEDNGILIQNDDVANEGPITVNVNSFPLYRQDYTLWSSPVKEQNLRGFSPNTLFNRFYSYDTALGTQGEYVQEIFTLEDVETKIFEPAKGYQIRMPNNWVEFVEESIPGISYPGAFIGVPQNGTVSIPLSIANTGGNLIGNPYPSPVAISAFFGHPANQNLEQTIYYWRKRNGAQGSGYATFTEFGFVSPQSEINDLAFDMSDAIKPGQGFLIKTTGASHATFTNDMRIDSHSGLFLRTSQQEKHRFWLRLSNGTNTIGQALIGYATNATQGVDNGLDGAYFNDSAIALTSLINGNEYTIQALSLPFDASTVVPLGFKTDAAGSYTISLSNFDGLFAEDQAIFIKDYLNGQVHNLKESDYSFTTDAGVFNSRFEIFYQTTNLDVHNPQENVNSVMVYKQRQDIHISSINIPIQKVELFDISGRIIYKLDNVNNNKVIINKLNIANQVLIVKVTSDENHITTKKIIY